MKTVLLKNMRDLTLYLLGQLIELILRAIRFLTPLIAYNYVLQMKSKPAPTTAIGAYLTPKSTFMFLAPGVILVNVDGGEYKSFFSKKRAQWLRAYPTIQTALQCLACLCIIVYFISRLFN